MILTILEKLELIQNVTFNKEQKEFITAPLKSILSESLPGTGKTFSLINRMINLECGYGLAGNRIWAMSFTNMATVELKNKHYMLCKKLHMQQTPNFSTIHSICSSLLNKYYYLIGMDKMSILEESTNQIANDCEYLQDIADSYDFDMLSDKKARQIYNCIHMLNSSLIFDPLHIKSCKSFKNLNIDYAVFNTYRQELYQAYKISNAIPLSDLCLYTLELLEKNPQVIEEFKKGCDVLIVDEFQDMSLLQLRIIALLAKQCIAIGDINQQIYAFQGACADISNKFQQYFPDALNIVLRQSYRCSEDIANFATRIILPNKFKSSKYFKGVPNSNSTIRINGDKSRLLSIIEEIKYEYNTPDVIPKTHMFLFRNNRTSNFLADLCYDNSIPCVINKYQPLYNLPIVNPIVRMIELLLSPTTQDRLAILSQFIYEFRNARTSQDIPLYNYMSRVSIPFMDVPYDYENAEDTLNVFRDVQSLLNQRVPFISIYHKLFEVYYKNSLKYREAYLNYNIDSMNHLVESIAKNYSYNELINRENMKERNIKDWTNKRIGVRCYTFHAAKGLEADNIYIMDADEEVIPNMKELKSSIASNAYREAAIDVRNERSLCYVAVTRAKTRLEIFYNKNISPLLLGDNPFSDLDNYYANNPINYSDVEVFKEFVR